MDNPRRNEEIGESGFSRERNGFPFAWSKAREDLCPDDELHSRNRQDGTLNTGDNEMEVVDIRRRIKKERRRKD